MRLFSKLSKSLNRFRLVGAVLLGVLSAAPVISIAHEINHIVAKAHSDVGLGFSDDLSCNLCAIAATQRSTPPSVFFAHATPALIEIAIAPEFDSIRYHTYELPRSRGPPLV